MKLGTQTGSVFNHIYSRAVIGQPEPVVGMGVTMLGWSDRHAGTIQKVEVKGKFTYVHITRDEAKRTDNHGMTDSGQQYEYTERPDAPRSIFRRKEDGRWQECYINPETGRYKSYNGGSGLQIGVRNEYYDYSF